MLVHVHGCETLLKPCFLVARGDSCRRILYPNTGFSPEATHSQDFGSVVRLDITTGSARAPRWLLCLRV